MWSVRTQFSPFSFPLLAFSFFLFPLLWKFFFLLVVSLNSMSLNTSFMTATLMFLLWSFGLQTHISYFLPDLSSWISNRHVDFKLAKTELLISHLQICSLSHCPVSPFFFFCLMGLPFIHLTKSVMQKSFLFPPYLMSQQILSALCLKYIYFLLHCYDLSLSHHRFLLGLLQEPPNFYSWFSSLHLSFFT